MDQKLFFSAWTKGTDWRKETRTLAEKLHKSLGGKSCDLAVFFVSEAYADFDASAFSKLLTEKLPCKALLGCNSSGIISSDKEIEMKPAISVMVMHLPGVKVQPFYISGPDSQYLRTGSDLINFIDIYPTDKPHFICLADPSTCDITKLLHEFNDGYKGLPVIGGLASGNVLGKPNWLALGNEIYSDGAVGVALAGNIQFDVIVSQGCRPIGKPFVITKADDNVLHELAGRPALHVLKEILEKLTGKDRALAEQSLFIGLVMNEHKESFHRGDFLVRNLMGFDPETGALMVGEHLKVGQTLQFQLRDAETSSEDLRVLLEKLHHTTNGSPQGGILVSCSGRGEGLFGEPDHDVRMIQQAMKKPLPLAGFFANGEIGPVGPKNYVHGYTSSLVILK